MKYYSVIKNEIMLFVTTWFDLEGIILNEIDRERQIPHDLTYMCNLKCKTNKQKKMKTDS